MNRLLACLRNFVEDTANQIIDYNDNDDDDDDDDDNDDGDDDDDDADDDTERQMAPAELVNVTSPAPVAGPTLRADTQKETR